MSTKKDVMVNPLLTREVRPALNLKEFFERWEASRDFDEMLGRLHRGFNVPLERAYQGKDEYIDFLTFYFSIADGWTYEDNLRSPADEEKRYRTGWEKRGNIEWKTPNKFFGMGKQCWGRCPRRATHKDLSFGTIENPKGSF